MLRIPSAFFLVFILCNQSCPGTEAPPVAKLDLDKIKPLLLDIAFNKPENKELKEAHERSELDQQEMMNRMMDRAMEGDFDPMEVAESGEFMDFGKQMEVQGKLDNLIRTELLHAIEEVHGDKYALVIDDSGGEQILFTQITIPDITANIRDHLLLKSKPGDKDEGDSGR